MPTSTGNRPCVKTKILKAAELLLETYGYTRLNTNRIAIGASVSVGAIYKYFRSKDEIVWHIRRRQLEALLANAKRTMDTEVGCPNGESQLHCLLETYVRHYLFAPNLQRRFVCIEQDLGQPAEIQGLWESFLRYIEAAAIDVGMQPYRGLASDIIAVANALLTMQCAGRTDPLPISVRIQAIASGLMPLDMRENRIPVSEPELGG